MVSVTYSYTLLGKKANFSPGPLVRIGPNTVSVDTNEGLQKIFSATSPIDKSPFYQSFAPGFDSSFAAVGDAFREKKSILSHAFAQKKLDAMEVTFMEHIKKLCEVMTAQKEVELDESLSALTIDILSDVCFGETFDLLHNPTEKKKVSGGLVQAARYVSLVSNAHALSVHLTKGCNLPDANSRRGPFGDGL